MHNNGIQNTDGFNKEISKDIKSINKIVNKVIYYIYGNKITSKNNDKIFNFSISFVPVYDLMYEKFKDKYRKICGEMYFEHLRGVIYTVLELQNPSLDKVFIALTHDCLEDTDVTFEELVKLIGINKAICVKAISKKPNKKGVFQSMKSYKLAKKKRNDDYFSNLESFEKMMNHINSIALSKGITLSYDELVKLTQDALDVKFADRISNLATQWHPTEIVTVKRKIIETKKYFYKIAKKTNHEAYLKLKSEVFNLEILIQIEEGKAKQII